MEVNDFIGLFVNYYGVDMENTTNLVRIKVLKRWIETSCKKTNLERLFYEITENFIPTGINPYPLIPHVKEIKENITIEPPLEFWGGTKTSL